MKQNWRLRNYNPDKITSYEIEKLIDKGYRFDIYAGLDPEDYDEVCLDDTEGSLCERRVR